MATPTTVPASNQTSTVPPAAAAPGLRGPRGDILLLLKRDGRATPKNLATSLGLSLNAVRHHLKGLEAEGVVCYERAHHGVGAPAHAYRLSAAGHELFPDRSARTVSDLLDHVVATEGRQAAVALLEAQYRTLQQRLLAETAGMDRDERALTIARVLHAEGYMATWEAADDGGLLTESNCPHRLIVERFPELCDAEEAFLTQVFGAAVVRRSRIAGGCGTCTYRVAFEPAESEVGQ